MIITLDKSCEYYDIISDVLRETTAKLDDNGLRLSIEKTDDGLYVKSDGKSATIGYSSTSTLLRGIGNLVANGNAPCEIYEKARYNSLGNMIDCSRNAVVKPETVKKICRISSLMGHNMLMLYTEDTYTVDEEPYFGHLRGRFSKEELHEIDEYASTLGIELIPCIQTLAHLDCLRNWPVFNKYMDIDNILNAADERVYTFIENMIKNTSESIKSRKINIGMDEAHHLGRGRYLDMAGYSERSDIMKKHLARVVEICRKYGYDEPMMWDDMFFRMCSKDNLYYDESVVLSKEAIDSVPENVNLIYWDYYSVYPEHYSYMLEKHKAFKNRISFAGGGFCWYGQVPNNVFSLAAANAVLPQLKNYDIDTVIITEWGDDAAETPVVATLPTMQIYGEANYSDDLSDENIKKKLKIFGADLNDFLDMDLVNFMPSARHILGKDIMQTHTYLLYNDPLQGAWDYYVPTDCREHFKSLCTLYDDASKRNPKYSYIFDTMRALSKVLENKAELGIEIKKAYDSSDRERLSFIASEIIPEIIEDMKVYSKKSRAMWRHDNKDFGIEIKALRFGGLMHRLEDCKDIITEYLNGERDSIPELEEERIPPLGTGERHQTFSCFKWSEVVSKGRIGL